MRAPLDHPADRPRDAVKDEVSPLAAPNARLAAITIDVVLPLAPILVLGPIGLLAGAQWALDASAVLFAALSLGLFVVDLVWLHRYGQSIGKRILGLRIVRADGTRASLGRIFWLRMVVPGVIAGIPLLGWVFSIIDAGFVFSPDRQTLHDRFADTIVIDVRRDARGAIVEGPTEF